MNCNTVDNIAWQYIVQESHKWVAPVEGRSCTVISGACKLVTDPPCFAESLSCSIGWEDCGMFWWWSWWWIISAGRASVLWQPLAAIGCCSLNVRMFCTLLCKELFTVVVDVAAERKCPEFEGNAWCWVSPRLGGGRSWMLKRAQGLIWSKGCVSDRTNTTRTKLINFN